MKKILSIIAVLACATACIYPYRPDLEDAPEGILVVDGNLVIGEKSTVQIGTMMSLWPKQTEEDQNMPGFYYARDIYWAGYGPSVQRIWAEDDAGGVYEGTLDNDEWVTYTMVPYSISLENAPANRQYRLCVQSSDLLYTSDWTRPLAAPVIKNITFKADKSDVRVNVTLDGGPDDTGYVLLSFDETWRFHTDYYPNYEYDPVTNSVFERVTNWDRWWCWKTMNSVRIEPVDYTGMSSSTLKDYTVQTFSRYDGRNHQRYSIRVKARTIDKQTYQFLSHLEESAESGDNLFTPNPGEITGNLRCEDEPDRMVLGYVTVALSTSKRVYMDSRYLLTRPLSPYSLVYPLATGNGGTWAEFYQMGYMPLIENTLPDPDPNYGPYGWGWPSCYDCVAAGGTLERPDFWED